MRLKPLSAAGAALVAWLGSSPAVYADAAADLLQEGTRQMEESDYPAAVATFTRLVTGYSNSPSSFYAGQVRLGWAMLLSGQYAEAIEKLNDFVKKNDVPEAYASLKLDAFLFLAQAYQRRAFTGSEAEAEADHQGALKAFGAFLKGKADHPMRDEALYGRALSGLMLGKHEDAIADLESWLKDYGQTEGKLDTLYLLANVYASRAANAKAADKPQSIPNSVAAARAIYDQLLREATDRPALFNEALFQYGELLLGTGSYGEAIAVFRRVRSKDAVVQQQKERIKKSHDRLRSLAGSLSRQGFEGLLKDKRREETKLQVALARPEVVVDALSKASLCYVQLNRCDEARVMVRHIRPFANKDQRCFLEFVRTLSFGMQGKLQETRAAFDAFRAEFGTPPLADSLGLLLGNLYLTQNQPQAALDQFNQSLKDYPKGRVVQEVMMFSGSAMAQMGDIAGARQRFTAYIKACPLAPGTDAARLQREMLLVQEKKWDEAVKALRALAADARDPAIGTTAAFRVGQVLMQAERWEDAAKELIAYEKNAPGTELAPQALYFAAQCHEKAGRLEPALQAYRAVVERYTENPAAPFAQQAIGQALAQAKPPRTEEALRAFKVLAEQFATTELGPVGWFYRASLLMQNGKQKEALATYGELVQRHPKSPYAADARFQAVRIWAEQVRGFGNYAALEAKRQKEWLAAFDRATEAAEILLQNYPASAPVSEALSELVNLWSLRVRSRIDPAESGVRFFENIINTTGREGELAARLRFALAGFLYEQGESRRALEIMRAAYAETGAAQLSREDLSRYGLALLEGGEPANAKEVLGRLQQDYPNDPHAQADVLFGFGVVALKAGDTKTADRLLERLPKEYAWSERVPQAAYYRGEALRAARPDEALKLFASVIAARSRKPIPGVKAAAMWSAGEIEEKRGKLAEAAGYFEMIDTFVGPLATKEAVDGLLKAGALFEKAKLPEDARRVYQSVLDSYPDHAKAKEAKARLEKLPAIPPPQP